MKPNKTLVIIIGITFLILGLGVWLISKPTAGSQLGAAVASGGKAEAESANFDWGTIDYGGGDVTATVFLVTGMATISLTKMRLLGMNLGNSQTTKTIQNVAWTVTDWSRGVPGINIIFY